MLIYLLWQLGQLTNQQIGEKFGLTYSAVSQRVSIFKTLLIKNKALREKRTLSYLYHVTTLF